MRQVRKAPQNQQHVVTYTVVLATSNLDGALLPGMTALVKIVIERAGRRAESAARRAALPALRHAAGRPPSAQRRVGAHRRRLAPAHPGDRRRGRRRTGRAQERRPRRGQPGRRRTGRSGRPAWSFSESGSDHDRPPAPHQPAVGLQDLSRRRRSGGRGAQCQLRHRTRRDRRCDGTLRLRKVDADEHDRAARPAQ